MTRKTHTKNYVVLSAIVAILIGIVAFQAKNLTSVTTLEVVKAEPVCTSLECEVERRTQAIFEREHANFMERARLMALEEMNDDMMEMTTNPEKRLNK